MLSGASMVQAQDSQSTVPETDERLVQQEQRIKRLEERIQQLEADAMGGAAVESPQMSDSPSRYAPASDA
jgi:type II secretory pathway component PulJ